MAFLVAQKSMCLLLAVSLLGCGGLANDAASGPPSAVETSMERAELRSRVDFIEQYVTFERDYSQLEYSLAYHNGSSGLIPGPTEWDIRILAVVPEGDIEQWVPEDAVRLSVPAVDWVSAVPGDLSQTEFSEWYQVGRVEVGLNRDDATVAYRSFAT